MITKQEKELGLAKDFECFWLDRPKHWEDRPKIYNEIIWLKSISFVKNQELRWPSYVG